MERNGVERNGADRRGVDGWRAFRAVPAAAVLLDADLVVIDATDAYFTATGTEREPLHERAVAQAGAGTGARARAGTVVGTVLGAVVEAARDSPVEASARTVLATGAPDAPPLVRGDRAVGGPAADGAGGSGERWWRLVTHPVLGADGAVVAVVAAVEDVTATVLADRAATDRERVGQQLRARARTLEVDLDARSQEAASATAALQVTARRLAGLADVALALVAAETVADLVAVVTDRGVSVLECDGAAVAVHALDDPALLELTVSTGFGDSVQHDGARVPLDTRLPACSAAATGTRLLLPDEAASRAWSPLLAAAATEIGAQAWASLPLRVGARSVGSLTMGWRSPRAFPADEVDLLEAFATQCAQALERILVRDAERARASSVRGMSEALQRSMLTAPPQPDHLQLAVRYQPAGQDAQVGGDWYDAYVTRDGATSLVIGDVTGHDRDAAAAMGQLRNLLRGIGYASGEPPARVLSELDQALRGLGVGVLATCVVARVEQDPAMSAQGLRRLRWSNAGHLPPLLLDPDGSAELLRTEPDLLLGLVPATARHDHARVLAPGSTLLLYTDGLVERRRDSLDDGLAWLLRIAQRCAALPLEDFCDALLAAMPEGVEDDVALLAVRAHPEERPRPSEAGPQVLPADAGAGTGGRRHRRSPVGDRPGTVER